jgi:hypothetical protein
MVFLSCSRIALCLNPPPVVAARRGKPPLASPHSSPLGLVLASTARRWGWCSLRSRKFTALAQFVLVRRRAIPDARSWPSASAQ